MILEWCHHFQFFCRLLVQKLSVISILKCKSLCGLTKLSSLRSHPKIPYILTECFPSSKLVKLHIEYWDLVLVNFYSIRRCEVMDIEVPLRQAEGFVGEIAAMEENTHLRELYLRTPPSLDCSHVLDQFSKPDFCLRFEQK